MVKRLSAHSNNKLPMPSYRFSRAAEQDLKNIVVYTLTQWGGDQASRYVEGLENLAEQLAANPKLGKSRADLFNDLRAFGYQKHTLYYWEEQGGIVIARVLHQQMSEQKQFNG